MSVRPGQDTSLWSLSSMSDPASMNNEAPVSDQDQDLESVLGAGAQRMLMVLPHPVCVLDGQDRVIGANPPAEMILGLSAAALATRPLRTVLAQDSVFLDFVARTRSAGQSFRASGITVEGPELPPHTIDAYFAPFDDIKNGVIVAIQEHSIGPKIDQPDQVRTILRPVSGLAAMLAHEIKNPLSGIKGAAQLLHPKVGEGEKGLTGLIRDEVDRICALIDRIDIFRGDGLHTPQPVNVHEVLYHVCRIAEAGFGSGLTIKTRFDPSLPPLSGERDRLVQVFLNLVKNACEAAGPGGTVTLTTGFRNDLRVIGASGQPRPHLPLEVCVIDSGPGVPAHLRETLFEPFVSARPEGSGLGLAITAKIVADHGGTIDYRSESGQTVFSTRWPMVAPSRSSDETRTSGQGVSR